MSVIFGVHTDTRQSLEEGELARLASATERYAHDGCFFKLISPIAMGCQPYYTHERSRLEAESIVEYEGTFLTFDGRLDNHAELAHLLCVESETLCDSALILRSFQRWGEECFSRFIGDWALALWNNPERTLYLARDHAGSRTLFFEQAGDSFTWSTYLETFFVERARRDLDERYAASYLAALPLRNLTPYKGIEAVPPAHYLRLNAGVITKKPHWQCATSETIRYRDHREYDEHFLVLFQQSIERRTGSGSPILAELSGGMDSSGIVCMCDRQRIASGAAPADLLDTISFYDDSEPDWNEKPYFSAVEAKRGKIGFHIDGCAFERTLERPDSSVFSNLLPGRDNSDVRREAFINDLIRERGYRVILSGIGGDELLGGVPTPMPELADFLIRGRLPSLLTRSFVWCLPDRTPLIQMLFKTLIYTRNLYLPIFEKVKATPPWLGTRISAICKEIRNPGSTTLRRFGRMPSEIDSDISWSSIMETLPHINPDTFSRHEFRYPYLDRDLVDFLVRVPKEQLLQPGRRRLLMRRALKGIVPDVVLERRRKAFLSRSLLKLLESAHDNILDLTSRVCLTTDGELSFDKFAEALENATKKRETRWSAELVRMAFFGLWLNNATSLRKPEVVPHLSRALPSLHPENTDSRRMNPRGDHSIYESSAQRTNQ